MAELPFPSVFERLSYWCTVLVLVTSVQGVQAELRPIQGSESLPILFDSASLVTTGRVISVEAISQHPAIWKGSNLLLTTYTATVEVDRSYKGIPGGKNITVSYDRPDATVCAVSECQSLTPGSYNLFFLRPGDRGYQLTNESFAKFAVAELKSAVSLSGLRGLEQDLVNGLAASNENCVIQNVELIGASERVELSAPLLTLLEQSKSDMLRGYIQLSLLRLRFYGQLRQAGMFLQAETTNRRLRALQINMADQIAAIRDPATSPVLIEFAASPSSSLRESAIHALREMGANSAVPAFIKALGDSNPLIRYDAVLGLATVEKRWDLAPSVDTFNENESKYVSAWRHWWQEVGKSQYDQ